jgi:hypothetical protein
MDSDNDHAIIRWCLVYVESLSDLLSLDGDQRRQLVFWSVLEGNWQVGDVNKQNDEEDSQIWTKDIQKRGEFESWRITMERVWLLEILAHEDKLHIIYSSLQDSLSYTVSVVLQADCMLSESLSTQVSSSFTLLIWSEWSFFECHFCSWKIWA